MNKFHKSIQNCLLSFVLLLAGFNYVIAGDGRQYFYVCVNSDNLSKISEKLNDAFLSKGFEKTKINGNSSCIEITAIKGSKIEEVKEVLKAFNLGILNYKEQYTAQAPSIFN